MNSSPALSQNWVNTSRKDGNKRGLVICDRYRTSQTTASKIRNPSWVAVFPVNHSLKLPSPGFLAMVMVFFELDMKKLK
jgi:hypothetical protein